MVIVPKRQTRWPTTHRLILSQYPPIDLFDDVADPHDWELLAAAEALTNPRIYEEIGDLSLVPPHRRLSGEGASWVMAAFTHISPDRQSRFSDGSFGIYYAGDSLETAFHEHAFHMAREYRKTAQVPGWISEVRQLIGTIDAELLDIGGNGFADLLNKDNYTSAQLFGATQKARGENGILYPSQRRRGGSCIAALFPNVVTPPIQGGHYVYHWSGDTIDYIRRLGDAPATFEISL